jgi:hypothetical protein
MMKKILSIMVAILLLAVGIVYAAMDDVSFTTSALTTGTAQTNTFVMRGHLERVYVSATAWASGTNTVAITSDGQTIFTKAVTANTAYYPQIAQQGTTGSAITFVGGTNDTANPWYSKIPVGGTVTVVQTHTGTTSTNTYTTKLLWSK